MVRKVSILILMVAALLGVYTLATAQSSGNADELLEANKALVERYVEEFANSQDLDVLDELLIDDFQEHNPFAPEFPPGRDAIKAIGTGFFTAFPDVHVTIDYILAEGDLVATRHSVVGTHEGDFNGVPPSGNEVTWTELHLWRIEDGQIAEHWGEVNVMNLLIQTGAMPAPQS